MRTVCTAKKIDMHTNRATRLRTGINFKMTAAATIAKQENERQVHRKIVFSTSPGFFQASRPLSFRCHFRHVQSTSVSRTPHFIELGISAKITELGWLTLPRAVAPVFEAGGFAMALSLPNARCHASQSTIAR
jgi:hypothetical protein